MRISWLITIIGAATVASLTVVVPACSSSESNDASSSGQGAASSSSGAGGANQAGSGGVLFNNGGGGGDGGDDSCAQSSSEATLINRPVDIVFVIDNSGSMSAEIAEVEKQINLNFANIINAANPPIDYRVIMVSGFGSSSSNRICVAQPLGGIPDANSDGHCDSVPSQPVNTANFFHHSESVSSHNSLCELLEQLTTADDYGLQPNGYQDVLRLEAFKFFAVITDDGVSCSYGGNSFNDGNNVSGGQTAGQNWDTALLNFSAAHFGTAEERNYSFWSIIALAPFNPDPNNGKPYGDPHPPDDQIAPIITAECTPSAVDPGTGYQQLSIMTGGYRYPTCGLDYTDIFTLMAHGVIEGAQVACEFEIPDPPPGETLDLETVQVEYSSGDTVVTTFSQVASLAECTATSFYIEGNLIKLCPEACDTVQQDEDAKINILFGCELVVD